MANVLFKRGTLAQYQALAVKDGHTLYWLTDVQELWKGDVCYGKGTAATGMASGLMSAEDKAKLDSLSEGGASGLTAVDASVVLTPGEDGASIGVRLSGTEGNALELKEDGLYVAPERVLQDGGLKYVETQGVPYEGAQVGDPYIDLVLNDPNSSHIAFPVGALVDRVEAGSGIQVAGNTVAVKLSAVSANGLFADEGGLGLHPASTEAAGAMSAEDKAALDSVVRSLTWEDL